MFVYRRVYFWFWGLYFKQKPPFRKLRIHCHLQHPFLSFCRMKRWNLDLATSWPPMPSSWGPEWGKDFADNQARFAYFCKAALKAIQDTTKEGKERAVFVLNVNVVVFWLVLKIVFFLCVVVVVVVVAVAVAVAVAVVVVVVVAVAVVAAVAVGGGGDFCWWW